MGFVFNKTILIISVSEVEKMKQNIKEKEAVENNEWNKHRINLKISPTRNERMRYLWRNIQ